MNAQLKKPPIGVIDSPNLTDFVLTKPQHKLLEKFCAMERYLALAKKKAAEPAAVASRLCRYRRLDPQTVGRQSRPDEGHVQGLSHLVGG